MPVSDNELTLPLIYPQVAELQLVYKQKFKPSERPKISSSKDSYSVFLSTWHTGLIDFVEEFKMLLLNNANRVVGCFEVSSGGFKGTIADPKVIFAAAITGCAASIVVAHNHPSGNLNPSQSDIFLTHKLKEGGRLLDIDLMDHIILTSENYYSFADEGLI